jgi:CubicO group peptidase (beta-lactamase class C family)
MRRLSLSLLAPSSCPAALALDAPPPPLSKSCKPRTATGDLRAVVVLRDGAIVAERYYNGATDTLHDIRSAGKSITALLVGAAVAQGRLATGRTVGDYWPEVANSPAGKVVLDDLLTMRSGPGRLR